MLEALDKRHSDESAKECVMLMENTQTSLECWNKFGFDFAVMDPWTATGCYLLLPRILNIPFAVYTFPTSWMHSIARIPRSPSFTPFISSDDSDEMTFRQRLFTFIFGFLAQVKYGSRYQSETMFAQLYLDPNMETSYTEMMSNASLWFIEEDLSLNYPSPHMPNSISIASIGDMARPLKPLSEDLESFLQSSQEPAILVSFGSYFDYVPEFLARGFCDAFRKLKYQVIWKLKNESHCCERGRTSKSWTGFLKTTSSLTRKYVFS